MPNFVTKNQTQTLANYLRNDKVWKAKNIDDTNLRNLLTGLAIEINRTENKLQEIDDNYDPSTTTLLLEEWESALGIPDDCFFTSGVSTEQRQNNILTKLTALGVSTKAGFEALGLTFGYVIEVWPGADFLTFPYIFPIPFGQGNARWTMIVNMSSSLDPVGFNFTFPITFEDGGSLTNIIVCLINKLVPTNIRVLYNYVL